VLAIVRWHFVGKGIGRRYEVVQEVRVSEEQSEREGEKSPSILYQWDATSLITCAKFQLEGRLIVDYVLDVARIVITREVQVEAGYAETVRQLHARYQRGELSFRAVADELGLSVRDLYDLFEKKGLPT
jgi:hypothetical protein